MVVARVVGVVPQQDQVGMDNPGWPNPIKEITDDVAKHTGICYNIPMRKKNEHPPSMRPLGLQSIYCLFDMFRHRSDQWHHMAPR